MVNFALYPCLDIPSQIPEKVRVNMLLSAVCRDIMMPSREANSEASVAWFTCNSTPVYPLYRSPFCFCAIANTATQTVMGGRGVRCVQLVRLTATRLELCHTLLIAMPVLRPKE